MLRTGSAPLQTKFSSQVRIQASGPLGWWPDISATKKKRKWKPVPDAPRAKLVQLKKFYAKVPEIAEALVLYELFRDIEKLDKVRESEFRKGVNLRVTYKGEIININLDKLKEYSDILERFISFLK